MIGSGRVFAGDCGVVFAKYVGQRHAFLPVKPLLEIVSE